MERGGLDLRPILMKITSDCRNTYVVGHESNKNWLMYVSSHKDGILYGTLDADRAYNPRQSSFREDQIVALLGAQPPAGSAYGCVIEPFQRTLHHEAWGDVHLFDRVSKQDKEILKRSLDKIASRLRKHHLFGWVQAGALALELRPAKGRYTGMYYYRTRAEGPCDRMILRPQDYSVCDYVIAHESGHGVWYRSLSDQSRARWVQLYHSYTSFKQIEARRIRAIRDEYLRANAHVADHRSGLDEEHTRLFDTMVRSLCDATRLKVKHLDALADEGDLSSVKDAWPHEALMCDFDVAVSEYGTKNPEEFWAESFAFWLTGKILPPRIKKALERALQGVVK